VDGARREHRADHAKGERERSSIHELAGDARLLSGGGWIGITDELHELSLRAVGPEQERQDADQQREQRDEGEEQLVRDASREESAFVVRERRRNGPGAADDATKPDQDAASLFDAGLSGAFVSDLLSLFVSLLVSVFVSALVSVFVSPFLSERELLESELFSPGRLSVLYQPEPLKTIAGVERSRRGFFPQLGHFSSASSLNDWTAENTWPQ
jgi:hypothetical protein